MGEGQPTVVPGQAVTRERTAATPIILRPGSQRRNAYRNDRLCKSLPTVRDQYKGRGDAQCVAL